MSYEYPVGRSIARKMEPTFPEARINTKPLICVNEGREGERHIDGMDS